MNKNEKINLFANELNYITYENLRQFACELIAEADDYFFTVPASSSGKYHPSFDLGDGGLVRHTRCTAFFTKCMCESFDLSVHDTDLAIVAAIAHDIKKQGNNTGHTCREHPLLAKNYVLEMQKKNNLLISEDDAMIIANAVLSHMGRWEHHKEFIRGNKDPYPMPSNDVERALQAGDYIASRKEIINFDFKETKNEINEETSVKNIINDDKVENYKISFGKYRDKTLKDIFDTDKAYLEWINGAENFYNKEAQDKVKLFLKNNIK